MSGYSKMNASPFQKRVMAFLAILCLVTLIFPAVYYIKYVAFDFPREENIAKGFVIPSSLPGAVGGESAVRIKWVRPNIDEVRLFMRLATESKSPAERTAAVDALSALCQQPGAQVFHWMECLNAKMTLMRVAQTDKDPGVVQAAQTALAKLGQNGVTFRH